MGLATYIRSAAPRGPRRARELAIESSRDPAAKLYRAAAHVHAIGVPGTGQIAGTLARAPGRTLGLGRRALAAASQKLQTLL